MDSSKNDKNQSSTDTTLNMKGGDERGPGAVLSWHNINVKATTRDLLDDVSGIAFPGQVVALMGASGAGKTTLLNVLVRRNLSGLKVAGEIRVNGQKMGRDITGVSCYVQQEDMFMPTLTVREQITMLAQFVVVGSWRQVQERVEEVIKILKLENCQNSKIGGFNSKTRGISGSESKRLAFAGALLGSPSLLFVDEPTTGLDSNMAEQTLVEDLAQKRNMTVICTIHQPSSIIFALFDRVIFLARRRVAFYGRPKDAYGFMTDCGYVCPKYYNLADFTIDNLAIRPDVEDVAHEEKRIHAVCDRFFESEHGRNMAMLCEAALNNDDPPPRLPKKVAIPRLAWTLFRRTFVENIRDADLPRARILQKLFMALFIGFLYFKTTKTSNPDQSDVRNFKGALFFYVSDLSYPTLYGILTFISIEFPLIAREHHDGLYPVFCYYLTKIVAYLPMFLADVFVLVCISYYIVGLRAAAVAFFSCIGYCILIKLSAASIGVMFGAVMPSFGVAVVLTSPLLAILSSASGALSNVDTIPPFISWIQYLSWFRYGYENLIVNQFSGINSITCPATNNSAATFCEASGAAVIANLKFVETSLGWNSAMLGLYMVFVLLFGYAGLVLRVQLSR